MGGYESAAIVAPATRLVQAGDAHRGMSCVVSVKTRLVVFAQQPMMHLSASMHSSEP